MNKKEQKIVIKYSFDKNGAMTSEAAYDMNTTVMDALVALHTSYDNLFKQALKIPPENDTSEKDIEVYLSTITINDLPNR